MIVKRIGPLSAARIAAALYGIAGLVVGTAIALRVATGQAASDAMPMGGALAAPIGAAAVIVLPIVYGISGFLAALITAVLYNALATIMGGIEIELESTTPTVPTAEQE